jgi:hypothetical protein
MKQERAIYACDVGSCRKGNFAWARIGPEQEASPSSSPDIRKLITSLHVDLSAGLSIALGFEAPLFIPVPEDPNDIGRARAGEGDRAFSAGAGASAALIGFQQAAWIMSRVKDTIGRHIVITDWQLWPTAFPSILLWEAFISGIAKGTCHADDAVAAARAFQKREAALTSDVSCERPISLVGAAAVWSGFSEDLSLLRKSVLVLRPIERFIPE